MAADLQSLFQYWKAFDLISLQKDLDISANELAARQDESEDSRKRLVEFSREFKKTTSEDVRKQVAPLLKNFQLEVDALSKRSKAAEAAFLNVYKKLIDVPDPSPGFEHALVYQKASQKLSDYEIENVKLRETLAEYNTEFAEVKNQEVTIKQLKEKIKDYEQRMDGEVQRQTHEKERELQRQFAEKEKQLHELQLSFAKRLGEAEKQISSLRTALETSQSELFDMKSKFDVSANAKSDEMDLLVADLERANERATLAERQVETLKEQLASLQKDLHAKELKGRDLDTAIDHMKKSNLEFELTTKEREVTQLVEEVHKLQTAAARQQQDSSSRMVRLTEELSKRDQVISELKNALSSQRDYQELQKELQILKSLEFFDANPSADVEQQKNKSLETLLLEKNRTLQNENTRIKNANTELTGRYESVVQQFNEAIRTTHEQKALIGQLEEDLRKVHAVSSMFRGDAEGEPSHTSEIVAEALKDSAISPSEDYMTKTAASESLVPILQSQRERYRLRCQELEIGQVALQQHIQMQQNEIDRIRSDNIKLYEKIKFLQNYAGNRTQAPLADDAEARYSDQYEQKLDPFTNFSKKEKLRKYNSLKPHEKITLGIGRFVMGNAKARTFAFLYALLLHLLVFLALYKVAHSDSAADSSCHEKFAAHMMDFHNDKHKHKL